MKKMFLVLLLMTSSALNAKQKPSQTITNQEIKPQSSSSQKSWGEIFQESHLAVFQIYAYTYEYNYLEPFKQPAQSAGSGTGFLTEIDGIKYMITNFHVISQAKPECIFAKHSTLPEERLELEYVGSSPAADIAILKFPTNEEEKLKKLLNIPALVALKFGNSDNVGSAQEVMAIGHPLGTEHVQTAIGHISGVSDSMNRKLLQTTTPVNPGNSGGPFLDKTGNVIGVCVAKGVDTEGIAFIIPERNISKIIQELLTSPLSSPPFWGFEATATLESTLHYLGNPTDGGVYVAQVYKGGLVEEAGIKKRDIIYAITDESGIRKIDRNGYLFAPWSKNKVRLLDYANRLETDTKVVITIFRQGEKLDLPLSIKSKKQFPIDWHYPWIHENLEHEVLGGIVFTEFCVNHIVTLQALSQYYTQLDLNLVNKYLDDKNRHEQRIIMTLVYPTSRLKHNTSFRNGDKIIKKINGIKVQTIAEFREAVRTGIGHEYLTIECEGGSFVCLPVQQMLEDEPILAARYGFDVSPLAHELAAGIE